MPYFSCTTNLELPTSLIIQLSYGCPNNLLPSARKTLWALSSLFGPGSGFPDTYWLIQTELLSMLPMFIPCNYLYSHRITDLNLEHFKEGQKNHLFYQIWVPRWKQPLLVTFTKQSTLPSFINSSGYHTFISYRDRLNLANPVESYYPTYWTH